MKHVPSGTELIGMVPNGPLQGMATKLADRPSPLAGEPIPTMMFQCPNIDVEFAPVEDG
jgi:hypothetical protein